jgi:tetratricopeptide (TPR) repeat protein
VDDRTKHDEAIRRYEAAVASDPGDVRTMLKLGDLLLRVGRVLEAAEWYERAFRHYEAEGPRNKAVAICAQLIQIASAHAELSHRLPTYSAWKEARLGRGT